MYVCMYACMYTNLLLILNISYSCTNLMYTDSFIYNDFAYVYFIFVMYTYKFPIIILYHRSSFIHKEFI